MAPKDFWMGSGRRRLGGSVYELPQWMLTVYNRIKLHMDLQADKSPLVVKGPYFP
jgi:hypothetical protein